ncbi:MAG: hypothetical protein ACSHWZ_15670 [Sulfitobacter sp.]
MKRHPLNLAHRPAPRPGKLQLALSRLWSWLRCTAGKPCGCC